MGRAFSARITCDTRSSPTDAFEPCIPAMTITWRSSGKTPTMDSIRRSILATGAAATAMAAAPRLFAQQTGQGGAAMSFYEKGPVRIHYEEAGSGFPLLFIARGGLDLKVFA